MTKSNVARMVDLFINYDDMRGLINLADGFVYGLFSGFALALSCLIIHRIYIHTLRRNRMYSFHHAVLNVKCETAWNNMGFWDQDNKFDFPRAAESLAKKAGEIAGIKQGNDILDAGCGCGDSLLLWEKYFHSRSVIGISYEKDQFEYAEYITREDKNIQVYHDDAVRWCRVQQLQFNKRLFHKIVALDCSYHFNTREVFLSNAFNLLHPGGRIVTADIIASSNRSISLWQRSIMRLVYKIASIPLTNMKTCEERILELESLGYTDVCSLDITDQVFLPLSTYLQNQAQSQTGSQKHSFTQHGIRLEPLKSYAIFAKFLQWTVSSNLLRYVIFTARRPEN